MKKWIIGLLLLVAAGAALVWLTLDKDTRNLAANMPTNRDVLFWTIPQRDAAFRAMDRLPVLAKSNIIEAGDDVLALPKGVPLKIDVGPYMKEQRTAALVIVHDGKIRLENYGLGFDGNGKWTSFSVAKSLTSTLVGAAIKDGYIKSIDDKVTQYIPEMKGSAYDDVSIAQLLTMTSGIKWNEDYEDRNSDVARFNEHKPEPGVDTTVSYMRKLPREAPAGTKWVYKTGETNLIGVLVSKATKKTVSQYLSEKVWAPYGMEQDASWLLGGTGHEISGCCIQASTRDMARFGLFMLGGGMIDGKSILPDGWIANATTKRADIGTPGRGYGYQWWTIDDGSYQAQGIFGQGIFIDAKRKLVIASNSNWPSATHEQSGQARSEFYKKVQAAIDAEGSTAN
jgi:CubicO group peptidase (beta-lactamase class C family)